MTIKTHIPNAITCCNLIAGCIATWFAFQGHYPAALLGIVAGAVFDFFDGMTARLLGVSSPIGKELDSLADDITFGLAPSAMIFSVLASLPTHIAPLPFVAFIMAAFSALRLAKFNLDERQAMGFIGLPTPANALFWAALVVGFRDQIATLPAEAAIGMVAGVLLSSYLLVSEIPMFALKFKKWSWAGNEVRYLFLIVSLSLILMFPITGIALTIVWYVLLSVITQKKSTTHHS